MGLGNFIKRQAGIGRLPEAQLNENIIINIFKGGAPFIVTLPVWDTVRVSGGSSISQSMGYGFSQRSYSPGLSEKRQRKIITNVNCTFEQLTIQHAQNNGKHIFIRIDKIAGAGLHGDRVVIELIDGRRYLFEMNGDIKNQWKTLGFEPQSAITVFYNMVHGVYLNRLRNQQIQQERQQSEEAKRKAVIQERIDEHKRMDERAEKNRILRIKEQERVEKEKEKERKEKIKEEERIRKLKEKERKEKIKEKEKIEKDIQKTRTNTINEFSTKMKKLKEIYDLEAISQEEFDELKTNFINEIISMPIPQDMNILPKIKECKELLDIGAITQEEFDKIKAKYIDKI